MNGARQSHPRPPARASRTTTLLLLAPLLLLSIFGGRTLHAHSHGERGMHVHIIQPEAPRALPTPATVPHSHPGCDDHHHPHAPGNHAPAEPAPDHPHDNHHPCLSLSIPERDMLPVRGMQLAVNADPAPAFPAFWTIASSTLLAAPAQALRDHPPRPPDPHPLRAGDRLVRTSLALLI